jgi:hypothetical protein
MQMPVHDQMRIVDKLHPIHANIVACRPGFVPIRSVTGVHAAECDEPTITASCA